MHQQRIAPAHFIKKVLPLPSLSPSPNTRPRAGGQARRRRRRLGWLPAPYCIKRERGGGKASAEAAASASCGSLFQNPHKKRKRERPPPFFRLLERKRGDSQSVRRQREKESNTPLLLIVLPKTVRGGERGREADFFACYSSLPRDATETPPLHLFSDNQSHLREEEKRPRWSVTRGRGRLGNSRQRGMQGHVARKRRPQNPLFMCHSSSSSTLCRCHRHKRRARAHHGPSLYPSSALVRIILRGLACRLRPPLTASLVSQVHHRSPHPLPLSVLKGQKWRRNL